MSRTQLIFSCYECSKKFASFDAMRAHVLFVHNHVVESCNIDIEKQQAEYRRKNKDKIAESQAEYYRKNKDKIAESQAEYRRKNKDKIAEYRRKNKDKIAESQAEYYRKNKDKIKSKYVKSARNQKYNLWNTETQESST